MHRTYNVFNLAALAQFVAFMFGLFAGLAATEGWTDWVPWLLVGGGIFILVAATAILWALRTVHRHTTPDVGIELLVFAVAVYLAISGVIMVVGTGHRQLQAGVATVLPYMLLAHPADWYTNIAKWNTSPTSRRLGLSLLGLMLLEITGYVIGVWLAHHPLAAFSIVAILPPMLAVHHRSFATGSETPAARHKHEVIARAAVAGDIVLVLVLVVWNYGAS